MRCENPARIRPLPEALGLSGQAKPIAFQKLDETSPATRAGIPYFVHLRLVELYAKPGKDSDITNIE